MLMTLTSVKTDVFGTSFFCSIRIGSTAEFSGLLTAFGKILPCIQNTIQEKAKMASGMLPFLCFCSFLLCPFLHLLRPD